ncbi:MAG: pseudouridine-5'-phosphate glycosidase, partial [Alphaproteobacteria bacterium]|nr:pseudouridine-5'-phosphate glycosidase [Alphaproteobacteria bacterium]
MTIEICCTEEVRTALSEGRPVVALESTIIAHGMPYPENAATAREVEALVRAGGAVPAVIAILQGSIRIGLGDAELEHLAREGARIGKVSVRDIPYVIARRQDGATTVASTMRLAAQADIKVFATGGIGGVHRGAETSFD